MKTKYDCQCHQCRAEQRRKEVELHPIPQMSENTKNFFLRECQAQQREVARHAAAALAKKQKQMQCL